MENQLPLNYTPGFIAAIGNNYRYFGDHTNLQTNNSDKI
jgi:hypothetical protein